MKKLIIGILILGLIFSYPQTANAKPKEVRGVWVSCFDYEAAGLSNQLEGVFRKNAAIMFSNIKGYGCNTVYFHVRSFDDAIYPSSNFGLSSYLSKTSVTYDPLKILIEESHKKGIKFHAWMNPYRISSTSILDPSLPQTTDRILTAVKEVVTNYQVDGIHFDDYFYPSSSHADYSKYKNVTEDQKKEYTNQMVRSVYDTIKSINRNVQFGISPAGSTSYSRSIGADIDTWLSVPGYVDYIIPQIYWTNDYMLKGVKTKMFSDRLSEWNLLNTANIPMYVGLALYRAGSENASDLGWKKRSTNIAKQVKELRKAGNGGYVFFSYNNFLLDCSKKEVRNYTKSISKMSLNVKSKKIKKGKTYTVKPSVWPSKSGKLFRYTSSNKRVATVSKQGVVRGRKKGTAIIKIKNINGKEVSCKVMVK